MALTSNAPAIAAADELVVTSHAAAAMASHTSDRTEPYPKYRVYRLQRRIERIEAARREARQDRRQAARAAAAAAARAAAQAQPSPAPQQAAPVQPGGNVSTAGMAAFEACVIRVESGGNPTAVNPSSGAGGLFQFLPSTWAALGFAASYPGGAQTAPASVQEAAFAKEYAEAGTSPWAPYDGC